MTYSEPVFRPPAEADSLIVQLTEGCSYNLCTFCPMYKGKSYRLRSYREFIDHLKYLREFTPDVVNRVFIGDGDALGVEQAHLRQAISAINKFFPHTRKLGIYGSVFSLRDKKVSDLRELKEMGLKYVYLGIESGDPEVLRRIKKYMEPEQMIALCRRPGQAGLVLSVTIVIGLGGLDRSREHIRASAEMTDRIAPTHTALLRLMRAHTPLTEDENYRVFSNNHYYREVAGFIRKIRNRTIFRADHASNPYPLRGILPRHRQRLLGEVERLRDSSTEMY